MNSTFRIRALSTRQVSAAPSAQKTSAAASSLAGNGIVARVGEEPPEDERDHADRAAAIAGFDDLAARAGDAGGGEHDEQEEERERARRER